MWSVRDLTDRIRVVLENDSELAGVAVRGEISNFTRSVNGHCYFVLKDDQAQLSAVMWKSQAARGVFRPENGMRVIAFGRITVYPQRGQYQMVVNELKPDGLGDLFVAYLQLKARLEKEGLFEPGRKRALPAFARRVGLVTSPRGAALHDMVTTLRRRYPGVDIVISPAVVQGAEAPPSIVRALRRLARLRGSDDAVDVIIVGRGGGSFEELNAFNDEAVARAMVASPVPVVSGVGHETDFTIADLVADERAATPTAAAARVVPDCVEAALRVRQLRVRLAQALVRRVERQRERQRSLEQRGWRRLLDRMLDARRQRLDETGARMARAHESGLERRRAALGGLVGRLDALSPLRVLDARRERLHAMMARMARAMETGLERRRAALGAQAGRLDALSPLRVLERGYAVCTTSVDAHVVTRIDQVEAGERVDIRVSDGSLAARVEGVQPNVSSASEAVGRAAIVRGGVAGRPSPGADASDPPVRRCP